MAEPSAPLKLAPGLQARQLDDGSIYVEQSGERKDQTVAFRVTATEFVQVIQPFVESFPQRQFSVAMRWLLDQPEVKELIERRVRSALS